MFEWFFNRLQFFVNHSAVRYPIADLVIIFTNLCYDSVRAEFLDSVSETIKPGRASWGLTSVEKYLPEIVRKSRNYREVVLSKAFRIVHGTKYNEVSYELRERNRGTSFQLYEAVLKENKTWDHLRDEVYPALTRYLKYKSVDLKTGSGVVVALFFSDHFYLIHYRDFVKAYCEMEDVTEHGYYLRAATWISRSFS